MKAALCKASPFTTKPARVGKPSPRRSPEQIPSSQREGGYSFLYSPLFAFFMRTVSHTLARQHRRCAALFYSGDSLRFPAYNGNVMPSWYTKVPVVYKPRCLLLFFMWELLCQFVRGRGTISPQCPGIPRVKPSGKSRLFSTGGQSLFLWSAFLSGNSFFCARFCGVAWAWKGPFPCGGVPILSQGGKAASPASASPWRTPANRCRTRLFSALKSAVFRGSQQPLGAFPLEEPGAIFPHPAARIDKEKGPWYNVHDPVRVALVFACWLAQGLFLCHQAAPGRMTRDGR